MDDFYAAREDTIPSLQWTSIAPPFTGCDADGCWTTGTQTGEVSWDWDGGGSGYDTGDDDYDYDPDDYYDDTLVPDAPQIEDWDSLTPEQKAEVKNGVDALQAAAILAAAVHIESGDLTKAAKFLALADDLGKLATVLSAVSLAVGLAENGVTVDWVTDLVGVVVSAWAGATAGAVAGSLGGPWGAIIGFATGLIVGGLISMIGEEEILAAIDASIAAGNAIADAYNDYINVLVADLDLPTDTNGWTDFWQNLFGGSFPDINPFGESDPDLENY